MIHKILIATLILLCGALLHGEGKNFNEPRYGIKMIYIEGGSFTMGCIPEQEDGCDEDNEPAHKVILNDFYIGKYEVTQKQWREIMGTDIHQQRDKVNKNLSLYGEGNNYPMYYVDWYDAVEFCNKLSELNGRKPVYRIDKTNEDTDNKNRFDEKKWIVTIIPEANGYRLPTEAEWEYAARGGKKNMGYIYSGGNIRWDVAWYEGTSHNRAHPVGKKKANELGIHDMNGNVWEYVWDWYGDYSIAMQTNPIGPLSGSCRVIRGGSWDDGVVRISHRNCVFPDGRGDTVGFRFVCNSN